MNFTHTTAPSESGVWHLWTLADEHGSLALSVLRTRSERVAEYAAVSPAFASVVTVTDGGAWVFDVMQTHTPSTDWSDCPRHEGCEFDAIVSSHADPVWARISAAGVTDRAVRAELETLHDAVFTEASR